MKKVFGSLLALALCMGCAREEPTFEPVPDRSQKLYSQSDEELVVRDFFDDRRDGFFVDVGAYQWRDFSTTYFLEKHLGWSGIAVDAQATVAEGYAENRPRTKFLNYAVTAESGKTARLYLAFGASSLDPNWHARFGEKRELDYVEVPTITLSDLLVENGVTHIDFLSIDIEGSEPAALAGYDIENHMPALVCIAAANHESIGAYFTAHGYELMDEPRDALNWYFRPKPIP